MLPLLGVRLGDFADLAQYAVVQHHAVQSTEALQRQVDGLLADGEVGQVAVEHLDLLGVLVLELLEGFDAARNHDDIVGLRGCEEVLGDGETDAWRVSGGLGDILGVGITSRGAGDNDRLGHGQW